MKISHIASGSAKKREVDAKAPAILWGKRRKKKKKKSMEGGGGHRKEVTHSTRDRDSSSTRKKGFSSRTKKTNAVMVNV